ncbi:MAG: class A beta-lactamase [Actinomadura sp.]
MPRQHRSRTTWRFAALAMTGLLLGGAACGTSTPVPERAAKVTTRTSEAVPDLRRELRRLETGFQGRIGAFAIDTETGRTVGYRANERFPMLSTFKAVAAAAVLSKGRENDPGLLDRRVRWRRADLVAFSPVTGQHVDTGLTVAQLCEAAITRSDNTAGNLLLRQIGGPAGLTRYVRSLGDPVSRLDRWETELNLWRPGARRDTTAPAYIGRDLHRLTVGNALDARDRARLVGWLRANTTGDARIRAGLPETWTVGDKTGTSDRYGAANDIAIAWPPSSSAPLIISIYTNRHAAGAANDDKVIATTATLLAESLGRR